MTTTECKTKECPCATDVTDKGEYAYEIRVAEAAAAYLQRSNKVRRFDSHLSDKQEVCRRNGCGGSRKHYYPSWEVSQYCCDYYHWAGGMTKHLSSQTHLAREYNVCAGDIRKMAAGKFGGMGGLVLEAWLGGMRIQKAIEMVDLIGVEA